MKTKTIYTARDNKEFDTEADMAEEIRLLRAGWYAAKAFIEASVSEDPPEDADELYDAYVEAGRKL